MNEHENYYKDIKRYLRQANHSLGVNQTTCNIEVMGVAHDGQPPNETLERITQADVITLELTRQVVASGLTDEGTKLLNNNRFWKTILTTLKEDHDDKLIRGIEVNQTPRVAWKRYSLHKGIATYAPSFINLEVDPDVIPSMSNAFDKEELEALSRYGWLVTDNPKIAYILYPEITNMLSRHPDDSFPLEIFQGITLVCTQTDAPKQMTFFKPPHPSIEQTERKVESVLQNVSFLQEKERRRLTNDLILTYLLTPVERSDAEQIAYFTNQYTRSSQKSGGQVDVLHVGGAAHVEPITQILFDSSPDLPNIHVQSSFDPRIGPVSHDLSAFFAQFIPIRDRLRAVTVRGFDTEINPDLVTNQVTHVLLDQVGDLERRISISREINKQFPDKSNTAIYGEAMKYGSRLYGKKF